jgi:hypothetical protein
MSSDNRRCCSAVKNSSGRRPCTTISVPASSAGSWAVNAEARQLLHRWPLPEPTDSLKLVNRLQTEAELAAVRRAVRRGSPFGTPRWQTRTAKRLGLDRTLRARGRPRKSERGVKQSCVPNGTGNSANLMWERRYDL